MRGIERGRCLKHNADFMTVCVEGAISMLPRSWPFWARSNLCQFHADPHAGKLFCTPDERLAIFEKTHCQWLARSIDHVRVCPDSGSMRVAMGTTRPASQRHASTILRPLMRTSPASTGCGRVPPWPTCPTHSIEAERTRFLCVGHLACAMRWLPQTPPVPPFHP